VSRGASIPGGRLVLALDALAKVALILLLLHAIANPDLPQYADKAMQGRAFTYPLAVLAIPVAWALFGRGRGLPFPALADLLITLPFLIDTAGNALDLYDAIEWWDDANHLFNWMLLTGGFVLLTAPVRLAAWNRAALGAGFAAIAAIAWELLEYATFIPGSAEAAGAYRDTLGDLVLGTIGGSLASIVASWWIARRERHEAADA